MLDGRRAQQLARNLAQATIEKRLNAVRAFTTHADALPWAWRSQMLDDWLAICGRCVGCAVRRGGVGRRIGDVLTEPGAADDEQILAAARQLLALADPEKAKSFN